MLCDDMTSNGLARYPSKGQGADQNSGIPNDSRLLSYRIASEVEITPFDTYRIDKTLLVVAGNKRYEVGGLACRVLALIEHKEATVQEICRRLTQVDGITRSDQEITTVINRLVEVSIIDSGSATSSHTGVSHLRHPRKSYFAVRVPLLPYRYLRPVTSRMAFLFSPSGIVALLPILLVSQSWFFWDHRTQFLGLLHNLPSGIDLVWLFVGSYLGLILHELGHASACRRFGVRHGSIGFALYLIFPALYTDVTESWRLRRFERMIVDAGGIYMSLAAATVVSLLFVATHDFVFEILAWAYDFTVLINLNPFVRMDGYWILSDALGVPNLMASNREMTAWFLNRLRGKSERLPRVLKAPSAVKISYLGYYLLFVGFSSYVGFRFYVWYLPQLMISYKHEFRHAFASPSLYGSPVHLLGLAGRLIIGSVPLAGLAIYSYRLADRLIRHRKNVSSASKSISEEGVIGNISRSAREFSIGR